MFKAYTSNTDKFYLRVTSDEDGQLLFFPVDVAFSLGYTRPYDAIRKLFAFKNESDGANLTCSMDLLDYFIDTASKQDVKFNIWFYDYVLPDARDVLRKEIVDKRIKAIKACS